jgi:hypothetical protein
MITKIVSLGFTINYEKSHLIPSQKIIFFGFLIDSVQFKVFLTEIKVQKIVNTANQLLVKMSVYIRELASFIGLLVNAFQAVLEGPMHYRYLERDKVLGLTYCQNYDAHIMLSNNSKSELKWWSDNIQICNGKHIRPKPVDFFIQTDASTLGWGAVSTESNQSVGGRWSVEESNYHINYLELLAIFHAMRSFCSLVMNKHVCIQTDSTCALSYVNNMGGMQSIDMDDLSRSLWEWCLKRDIYISAIYLPGVDNTSADFFSRNFSDSTEWMLKRDIFSRLCNHFFQPDIDLFASRLNFQIDKFVSWNPEPGAFKFDAFSFSWHEFQPYIFPPFSLIGKIVNKITCDKVDKALMIIPYWPSQPWFPLLMACIVDLPARLPRHKDLLILPHSKEIHPLKGKLKLIGVVVSGQVSRVEDFQRKLLNLSAIPGEKAHKSSITLHGGSGTFGVLLGKTIPIMHLKK